jgi:D-alanyl-lipoteichoic acid acyltransferase DltB (MBOAT superfamily)
LISRILATFLAIIGICLSMEVMTKGGRLPVVMSLLDGSGSPSALPPGAIMLQPDTPNALRVTTEFPGFGGSAVMSIVLRGGAITFITDKQHTTFRAEDSPIAVAVQANETGKATALILAETGAPTIEYLSVKSLSRHQQIWPTRMGIIAALLLFLPVAFALGFIPIDQQVARRNIILISSLLFLAVLSLSLLSVILAIVALGYLVCLAHSRSKLGYFQALAILAIPIILFKFLGPVSLASFDVSVHTIWLPIGLSFLVARQIDLAIKLATGQQSLPSVPDYVTYSVFWPSLCAGPVTQYDKNFLGGQILLTWEERASAGRRISAGLAKKMLADLIFLLLVTSNFQAVFVSGTANAGDRMAMYFGNMLFVYLDFAGYTDIALGTARWMGVRLPENFDNPLLRSNLREFWRHWHMSLTQWVNRIVYMPLTMAMRRQHSVLKYVVPVAATTLTIGLWHGLTLNWLLWGLHHALGIFISDLLVKLDNKNFAISHRSLARKVYKAIGIVFVWYWLMLSYTFTLSSNVSISLREYTLLLLAPLQIFSVP